MHQRLLGGKVHTIQEVLQLRVLPLLRKRAKLQQSGVRGRTKAEVAKALGVIAKPSCRFVDSLV